MSGSGSLPPPPSYQSVSSPAQQTAAPGAYPYPQAAPLQQLPPHLQQQMMYTTASEQYKAQGPDAPQVIYVVVQQPPAAPGMSENERQRLLAVDREAEEQRRQDEKVEDCCACLCGCLCALFLGILGAKASE